MSEDSELIDLIDFIYAAVLDAELWPTVLAKLADATKTMQAIIATMDRRTANFASISRRTYPDLEACDVVIVNPQGNDALTSEQTRVFETAARHIARAARVHRQLWTRDLMHGAAPERFESLRLGAILVDGAANVLFTNARARAALDAGYGLVLKGGCLASTDGADTLQRLIASCGRGVGPLGGPLGGELDVRRGPNRLVTVHGTSRRSSQASS